jgi:hypothetical protein
MAPRPRLHPFPLAEAMASAVGQRGAAIVVTMSEGQWDGLLRAMYEEGAILLELNDNEVPVRAYRKTKGAFPWTE